MYRPHVLLILDGFGLSLESKGNAVAMAKIPHLRYISQYYPGTALQAAGIAVGIPWGEVGNSEVGHTNIGAGTVIYQNLPRINIAIEDKSFFELSAWKDAAAEAEKRQSSIHIMGLLSNGGIHAHIDHLFALLKTLALLNCTRPVFIHGFTDGRDVPPQSAKHFIELLENEMRARGVGTLASISGRYLGLDRGGKWDRTKRAYDALVGEGEQKAENVYDALAKNYAEGVGDEMIPGTTLIKDGTPVGAVSDNDVLMCFNFRADRMRQILAPFVDSGFNLFPVKPLKNLYIVTMTEYDAKFDSHIAFPPQHITHPLARVVADAGKAQYHIAEKEKYAHITYFLNGGVEHEFLNETRAIVPSATDVTDYDQRPEMATPLITEKSIAAIQSGEYDFIAINFANGDMVGHTGNLKATLAGLEVADECAGKIMNAVLAAGGALYVTADHGNCEEMINLETGEIDTEHSTNPVPFWIVTPENKYEKPAAALAEIHTSGILADVAPTIIELMELKKPKEMNGTSLLKVITQQPLP